MSENGFRDPNYWSDAWVRHIEAYLAAPPRCGIWLKSLFPKNKSILECAGGSCRDSRYLYNSGYHAVGTDFDEKTLSYVRQRFAGSTFQVAEEDAYGFRYEDKLFDLTFHNGFWVLFDSKRDLIELLKEQSRITRRTVVALVHNARNRELVARFKKKAKHDTLYKIRFFETDELVDVVRSSGIKYSCLRFEKFGGPADRLFSLEKRLPFISQVVRWFVPKLYRFQPWSKVERIALIVDLE